MTRDGHVCSIMTLWLGFLHFFYYSYDILDLKILNLYTWVNHEKPIVVVV